MECSDGRTTWLQSSVSNEVVKPVPEPNSRVTPLVDSKEWVIYLQDGMPTFRMLFSSIAASLSDLIKAAVPIQSPQSSTGPLMSDPRKQTEVT